MKIGLRATGSTRLLWSLVLGMGLALGLLLTLALRPAAENPIVAADPGVALADGAPSSARGDPAQAVTSARSDSAAQGVSAIASSDPGAPAASAGARAGAPSEGMPADTAPPIEQGTRRGPRLPRSPAGPPPAYNPLPVGAFARQVPEQVLEGTRLTSPSSQASGAVAAPAMGALASYAAEGARGTSLPLAPPLPGSANLAICMTSERVWGVVGAGEIATVTVRGNQMGAALADNIGFFWTTLYDASGDRPGLSGGDAVAIYEGGVQQASVTLRAISGQIDVLNDVVSGTISGAPVSVTVYIAAAEPSLVSYSQTVSTDGSGNFTADFSGIWDLVPWAEAAVAYVESGVEVHRHVYPAAGLMVRAAPWNVVFGPATPGATVTVTLYASDGVTEKDVQTTTASSPDGFYFTSVSTDVLESDIVAAELAGGTVMSRTIERLTEVVDAANDRVTGETSPGATVRGIATDLTPDGWRAVQTSTTAEPSGAYTLDFGGSADLVPGRWVHVLVPDAEGDELTLRATDYSIEVSQTWNDVYGYGAPPFSGGSVTLTLSTTGTTYTQETGKEGDYSFTVEGDGLPDLTPGTIVTVESEGWQGVVEVMTMTVAHDLAADQFTGTVEPPTGRVEVSGWHNYSDLYPLGGSFDTLTQATSPFTAAIAGFDVDHGASYGVVHRTPGEYVERVTHQVDWFGMWMTYNGVYGTLAPAGSAYTITLYDGGGGQKAQLTGDSMAPIGDIGWNDFWPTGEQISSGDTVQVQSAAGFSHTVQVPALTFVIDAATDVILGQGPPNALLYISVGDGNDRGFVPTDSSGQFAVAADQLQQASGSDLAWGDWAGVRVLDENRFLIGYGFDWPRIIAHYRMDEQNDVWGRSLLGKSIHITISHPLSGVLDTGTTNPGGCGWCGPNDYRLVFPDGTIVPNSVVEADFGEGYVDNTTVLTVTAEADVDTDIVTITAPVGSPVSINADGPNGGWDWYDSHTDPLVVGASGTVIFDLSTEYDIVYGTEFNVHVDQDHGHQTHYTFWIPAPELRIDKWTPSGHARPGGVYVYGIYYENGGNGPATDTLIVDTLPTSTTYAGDTSGFPYDYDAAGGVITWYLGELAPNDYGVFMVTLDISDTIADGGSIDQNCAAITTATPGDYDPGNNEQCTNPVDVWDSEVDVSVDKWAHPDDPTPGEEFEYHIDVCGNRGAAAGPVWLTDTLPISTTLVSWRPDDWQAVFWTEVVTTGDQVVLYAPGYPGDTCQRFKLRLLLDPAAQISTTLYNHIVITTPGDAESDGNWRMSDNGHVSLPRYDLRLDKHLDAGRLVPGGYIRYRFDYRNEGNAAIQGWLTDSLPPGTSFKDSWQWGWGGGPVVPLTVTGDTVVWDLGVLPINEGAGFNLMLNISDTVTPGDVLTNCARVGSAETEGTPWDNESCVATTVYSQGLPNLYATKESRDYRPGNEFINYRISFGNWGDETVYDVRITDTFPISTSYDWHNVNWHASEFTETVSATELVVVFERIEPDWNGDIDFSVRLDDPGGRMRWYTNTIEIDTPPDDANPANNADVDVVFSGGEVDRVELEVGRTHMWGQAPSGPITITTHDASWSTGDTDFDWDAPSPFQPGDRITVAAGSGDYPVIIDVPAPFDVDASSVTDTVWGQIDTLDHEWVTVDLDYGPNKAVSTDGSGNYSATFTDIPHGGRGWVRYDTEVNHAQVTFHRQFQTPDLLLTVDYEHDFVNANYEAGHTVWLTVTESDPSVVKATAQLTTAPVPDWGGSPGFSTEDPDWSPSRPDVAPGDWVFGLVDAGYTSTVRVGVITGAVSVDDDVVSGTIGVPWFAPSQLIVNCEIHEHQGPQIQVPGVDADGGSFWCDFSGQWDLLPGHNVALNYREPDGDIVQTHPSNPAPHLRINKWVETGSSPAEGGNYVFRIQYTNDGDAPAENTLITDTMTGMTYIMDTSSFAHTGATGAPGDPIVWTLGTLPANSSGQFDLFVQITEPASNTITNTIQIGTSNPYDQGDPDDKERTGTWHVVSNDTYLNVGKSSWTGDPAPGYDFVYAVNVCNNGSTASSELTLTDTIHPSVTLQYWWGQHPGWVEVNSSAQLLEVRRPSIPAWWCGEVYLRVRLADTAWAGLYITNTAVISASNDLDGGNDAFWDGWASDPRTNLSIDKSWNWGQPVPGGQVRYNINFNNNGNVPVATTIRITDTLPVSTTFNHALGLDGGPLPVTPVFTGADYVVWELSGLDNGYGEGFEIVLNVDGAASAGTVLTNCATLSIDAFEENPYDNVACVTDTLRAAGTNLRVTKFAQWHGAGHIQYQAQIENIGTATVYNVALTDTYPLSMSLTGWHINYGQDWSGGASGNQITATLDRLEPGWSTWLDVQLDVPPVPNGTFFTNTIEVITPPDDVHKADNRHVLVVGTGPDLSVEKWLTDGTPRPGQLLTYTLHFENHAQAWGTDGSIWLTDTLPSGMAFVAAAQRLCGSGDYFCPRGPDRTAGMAWAWDHGQWSGNSWNDLLVTVRVTDTAQSGDVLTNVAIIATDQPASDVEPSYADNTSTWAVTVLDPVFEVNKVFESSQIARAAVTYTLTVTNSGNLTGTNVVLSDTLPQELGGGGITWVLPSVAPYGGTASRWFTRTLPCMGTVTNDDYRVVSSDEGVSSPPGPAAGFVVSAPALSASFDHSAAPVVAGLTATFTDTSSTDGPSITEYAWDFGDGSAHAFTKDASHAYTSDGAFTVTLTVTDSCGYSDVAQRTATVNAPALVADFVYRPLPADILTGESVIFTDTSTTDGLGIVAWEWDFGDGSGHAFTQDATHAYSAAGTYTVTLVVNDALGYHDAEVKAAIVTVTPRCTPLVSTSFSYVPPSPLSNALVTFTASIAPIGATAPVTYTWDFDDGPPVALTTPAVQHTFAVSGTYTVQLTAYNPCTPLGVSDQKGVTVAPRQMFLPLVLRRH